MFKKILSVVMALCLCLSFAACGGNDKPEPNDSGSPSTENSGTDSGAQSGTASGTGSGAQSGTPSGKGSGAQSGTASGSGDECTGTTIYLAGDSTVKTYNDNQFIAGWGQYLSYYLDSEVNVVNKSQGGRSSRSFINEGRLFTNPAINTTSYTSIESEIEAGDYLVIQFGHNDDESKKASDVSTLPDRMVPLGTADSNGKFPTTAGTKVSTASLPVEYANSSANATDKAAALQTIGSYGSTYYSYDCGGTYKWYLKQYIDFARAEGATPILVTPVARVKFSGNEIIGGAGLHGENFAYVQAVRQLAEEENCLLIDLFADTKTILETATSTYANYLMALKPNELTGTWPVDFEATFAASGHEGTHYNKYGAYLTAAKFVQHLLDFAENNTVKANGEGIHFGKFINTQPSEYIQEPVSIGSSIVNSYVSFCGKVSVMTTANDAANLSSVISKIDALDAVTVSTTNYAAAKTAIEDARTSYNGLRSGLRASVTNYSKLTAKETELSTCEYVVALNANDLSVGNVTDDTAVDDTFAFFATAAKPVAVEDGGATATINGRQITTTKHIKLVSGSDTRCIQIKTEKAAKIRVIAQSLTSGTARVITLQAVNGTVTKSTNSVNELAVYEYTVSAKGTYNLINAGYAAYVYYIEVVYVG